MEEELYSAVEETLESKGVLSNIRAQLRAAVFEAILDVEGNDEPAARERLRAVPHGDVALELVTDFLATCGLERALCVLLPEAGLTGAVDRSRLRAKMGLRDDDKRGLPVLCALLDRPKKNDKRDEDYEEDDFEVEDDAAAVAGDLAGGRRPHDDDDVVSDLDLADDLSLNSLDHVNEHIDFSAHIATVEGSHVLDHQGDLVEPVDAP
ncbi:hypothetical protein CTAYLR_005476 [Chrysophaeum taylorii]|uniref:LisH domain-containing protein n=1 Tax=Chrysophaeum taylorii TaxID=2483200 RepID=A0AAD7U4S7_9STRA|nr:hypothetical protein CTAYLR_005476 [Chrysophaeum taylorii]